MWETIDGEIVVIHGGEDISETTNGSGLPSELTLKELKELDAGEGEQIPTFEEVVQLCKGSVFMNIEIKIEQPNHIVHLLYDKIKQFDLFHHCAVCSFGHQLLHTMHQLSNGNLELGFLYDISYVKFPDNWMENKEMLEFANTLNFNQHELTPEIVHFAHSRGKGVLAWITGNEDEALLYEKLLDMGVDSICCNYPDRLRQFILNSSFHKEKLNYANLEEVKD